MRKSLVVALGIALLVSCGQQPPQETGKAAKERPEDASLEGESPYRYQILEHNTPITMQADSSAVVILKLRNTSSRIWPMRGMIKVGCYWTDSKGERIENLEGRGLPQKEVRPDELCNIKVRVTAPPMPGTYYLVWDMVEEHVVWFGNRGAVPLRIAVTVS